VEPAPAGETSPERATYLSCVTSKATRPRPSVPPRGNSPRDKLLAMFRLIAALYFVVAMGCVDLSRPQVLVTDGPAPGKDVAVDRAVDTDDGDDSSPTDAAIDSDPDAPDGPEPPDGNEEVTPTDTGFDVNPPDAPPAANGSPCENPGQCVTGNCVRGICCDTACTADCFACNVANAVGLCTAVPAGEDPGGHCEDDLPASCDRDGTCDGQGGCRIYKAGTICAAGGCALVGTVATESAASTCNAAGTCIPGATQACNPNVCMGASCGSTCTLDSQCQTGFFCSSGMCAVKKAQAAACDGANQCASGYCVDRVCCDSACGNTCYSCTLTGKVGLCTVAPSGQDPRNQCAVDATTPCGQDGECNGLGACRLQASGTSCAAGTCTGTSETAARQCNGAGVCLAATVRDCSPYLCGASACNVTCSTSAQCQAGRPCAGGRCATIPDLALFWRFEEAAGTTAVDDSGNARNGLYTGGTGAPTPSLTIPPLQYVNTRSRDFVMASRHAVQLAPMPAALKPTANITMSAWYRATAVDGDGSQLISGGNAYGLRLGGAQIEVSKRVTGTFVDCRATVSNYLDGNWHHVVGVIATGTFHIYFDGTLRATCAQSQPIAYSGTGPDLWVGRHGDNQDQYDFGGQMDEIRVYTRVLSATEIAALAAGGH
jgi:hypothetical protein